MKRLALILLIGLIALSCTFAKGEKETAQTQDIGFHATGLPITDEKVTFELAAKSRHNKNFNDLEFFKNLEEQTNVHINWNMSPETGWEEKKGLLFAGDLPDAFYGQNILTEVDVINYGSQGLIIPLEDLIDQYCPNLKALLERGNYRKEMTAPDGHIYALPNSTELSPMTHDKLFINKTWLDQLGLPIPETIDEFVETLRAFKANDMNGNGRADEIPFSFLYNRKENGLFSLFGSFGQLDKLNHWIVDENGNPVYTAITEPYKEAIEFFNSLYKEGLIDKEGFTHDFQVYLAKVKQPETIVGAWVGWSLSSASGVNAKHYVALAPLKGEDGKQIWNSYPSPMNSKGSFVITKACKHPEALMRWADMQYEPMTSLQIDQGLLGRTLTILEDGTIDYLPVPEGKTFTEMIHDYSPGVNGIGSVTTEVSDKLHLNKNLQERKALDEFFAPYNVPADQVFPSLYFTMEETERLAVLEADIVSYVDQCYANWIVNGGIEKEWDSYLKKLDKMGLQEYMSIYKAAYERYKNN